MNLDVLACSRDHAPLKRGSPDSLVCIQGHFYPVVGEMLVLILDDIEQSIDITRLGRPRRQPSRCDRPARARIPS